MNILGEGEYDFNFPEAKQSKDSMLGFHFYLVLDGPCWYVGSESKSLNILAQ